MEPLLITILVVSSVLVGAVITLIVVMMRKGRRQDAHGVPSLAPRDAGDRCRPGSLALQDEYHFSPSAEAGGVVPDANPLIQLLPLDPNTKLGPVVSMREEVLTGLQPLLQRAPSMAVEAVVGATPLYRMVFSPEVSAALHSGALQHMQAAGGGIRAMAVGTSGQIAAHGSLFATTALQSAAVATAVWQVLAVITAQKYLSDIKSQLAKIQTSIDDIRAMLHDEQLSKLTGSIEYLRTIYETLRDGALTEDGSSRFLDRIEATNHEVAQLSHFFQRGMERERAKLEHLPASCNRAKTLTEPLHDQIQSYRREAIGVLMAQQVKCAAAQMRCALPGDRELARRRLSEVSETLRELDEEFESYESSVEELVKSARIRWRSAARAEAHRERLRGHLRAEVTSARDVCGAIGEAVEATSHRLTAHEAMEGEGMSVAVQLTDDGKIQEVRLLESGA